MKNLKTFILVKNIPLDILEQIIITEITNNDIFNEDENILAHLKNSKLLLLSFPNLISAENFENLYISIASYTTNLVSPSEIVAVYNTEYKYLKSDIVTKDFTVEQIFKIYKLNKGPLHLMLTINKNSISTKKWWEFWKN